MKREKLFFFIAHMLTFSPVNAAKQNRVVTVEYGFTL